MPGRQGCGSRRALEGNRWEKITGPDGLDFVFLWPRCHGFCEQSLLQLWEQGPVYITSTARFFHTSLEDTVNLTRDFVEDKEKAYTAS